MRPRSRDTVKHHEPRRIIRLCKFHSQKRQHPQTVLQYQFHEQRVEQILFLVFQAGAKIKHNCRQGYYEYNSG